MNTNQPLCVVIYSGIAVEDHSDELEQKMIDAHNKVRPGKHKLTKLKDHAYTRDRCKKKVGQPLSKSPKPVDPKYGENVYRMNGKGLTYDKVAGLVVLACNSGFQKYLLTKNAKEYKWLEENPDGKWLSFTQVMWKDTKEVTCAICGDTKDGKTEVNVVCNYLPAGNVKDHYKNNMIEPLARSTSLFVEMPDDQNSELDTYGAEEMGFSRKALK
ncbi:unnamed protein product [Oppiella nova]|uniref:SCP domain-containing protein n=1 Tax=Oppiella nova TaxID=334625 RepID=A0A7R9LN44_9ACAR|nr:unnamed protein product [Oppiella nova]CAG2164909.1 unnamed protein product [Oppiella nova]